MNDYDRNVSKSQSHLLRNYLEKLNPNKEELYIKEIIFFFVYKESIVYPLVKFEPNYNKKEDLFFLSNNSFIQVLNCVQFTAMGSLF